MKRRFPDEQIIGFLREAWAKLAVKDLRPRQAGLRVNIKWGEGPVQDTGRGNQVDA